MKSKIKFTYSYFVEEATFLDSIMMKLKPFQPTVAFHIEISYLISSVNQITVFYVNATMARDGSN